MTKSIPNALCKSAVYVVLLGELFLVACHIQSPRSASAEASPFREIRLPVNVNPSMVTLVDANKDGNPDILIVGGNLSVFLGDGKGNFAPAQGSPFPAGQNPSDITTADFNGDGNIDVAIANHNVKTVTVSFGDGKGRFALAPGSPFAVESSPHPHGIAVADFNGDKKPDIATDSWAENKVLVLFSKGDGTFLTPGVKLDTGKMPYHQLRTADVDRDGNADIVTSNFEDAAISILLGDGRGSFTRKDFSVPPNPFGVAITDLNGDEKLDIAVFHYSGHAVDRSKNGLSLLVNGGARTFTLAHGSPFSVGQYPSQIAAGDLNSDGIADIALTNYEDGTLTIYFGGKGGIRLAPYSPIRVGRTPHGVAVADLNHDGKGDIVVAQEEDRELRLLLSK